MAWDCKLSNYAQLIVERYSITILAIVIIILLDEFRSFTPPEFLKLK